MTQFGSFGKCAYTLCLPEPCSTCARGSTGSSWDDLEVSWLLRSGFPQGSLEVLSSEKISLNSCTQATHANILFVLPSIPYFSFDTLKSILLPFLVRCGCWPRIQRHVFPWSSQSFPNESTAGVSSRNTTLTNKSNCLTFTVASSLVCTSPLAVITVVGLLDVLMVSNSAELRSFLLTICILAPESTTNYLSSGSFVDAAGSTHSSAEKWNAALSFSLSLQLFLPRFQALLRAHRCCRVSSWDLSSNFTA